MMFCALNVCVETSSASYNMYSMSDGVSACVCVCVCRQYSMSLCLNRCGRYVLMIFWYVFEDWKNCEKYAVNMC